MKNIEEKLLHFLEQECDTEENYENLNIIIKEKNILDDDHYLKPILYLINNISKNHHRPHNFFNKIEQILNQMKEKIKQFYSNKEIFKIFKKNKRILLFLIKENILTIDQYVYDTIISTKYQKMKYQEFFSFEINKFNDSKFSENNQENFEKFDEKRKIGENDGYLYKIIQNDLIEEFIIYVNKESYSLHNFVEESIFETNDFLLKQDKTNLIEYAAFFGSTQIFKYLYKNGCEITENVVLYAIHGYDEEIIHIIEEDKVFFTKQHLVESIKCHHVSLTNYIEDKLPLNNEKNSINYCFCCLKFCNFISIDFENVNNYINNLLFFACKYDYYEIVDFILKEYNIDISKSAIFFIIYLSKSC